MHGWGRHSPGHQTAEFYFPLGQTRRVNATIRICAPSGWTNAPERHLDSNKLLLLAPELSEESASPRMGSGLFCRERTHASKPSSPNLTRIRESGKRPSL